jgi:hypothetical protein
VGKNVSRTEEQYDAIIAACRGVYCSKTKDYGTAWRILRPSSLTDQLFIKAKRIRTIEETQTRKIADGISQEYMGIVNYSLLALIQLSLPEDSPLEEALRHFDEQAAKAKALMMAKNHDYGEAWRDMRLSSITDLILMKILRVKQIENNEGITLVSEGLEANYLDILNYAVFALIHLREKKKKIHAS